MSGITNDEVTELVSYLRKRFAPDKPPRTGVNQAVSRVRHGSPFATLGANRTLGYIQPCGSLVQSAE